MEQRKMKENLIQIVVLQIYHVTYGSKTRVTKIHSVGGNETEYDSIAISNIKGCTLPWKPHCYFSDVKQLHCSYVYYLDNLCVSFTNSEKKLQLN